MAMGAGMVFFKGTGEGMGMGAVVYIVFPGSIFRDKG